jgi:hypothetical protein
MYYKKLECQCAVDGSKLLKLNKDRMKVQLHDQLLDEFLEQVPWIEVLVDGSFNLPSSFSLHESGSFADTYIWHGHEDFLIHITSDDYPGNDMSILPELLKHEEVREMHHLPVAQIEAYIPKKAWKGKKRGPKRLWISIRKFFHGPTLEDVERYSPDGVKSTIKHYEDIMLKYGFENRDTVPWNFFVDYDAGCVYCFDYGCISKVVDDADIKRR